MPLILSIDPIATPPLSGQALRRPYTVPFVSRVADRSGALFETPDEREEEQSSGGIIRVAIGAVRAAIVGVKDSPRFEMCDDSLYRSSQRGDFGVAFFVPLAELTAPRLLARSGDAVASLIALIADSATRGTDDLRHRGAAEGNRVVSIPGKRVRNINRLAVEQTHQLRVEARGAVLTAPQLLVVGVRPAWRNRAIHQAHTAVYHLDGVGRTRHEFFQHRRDHRDQVGHIPGDGWLRNVAHIA